MCWCWGRIRTMLAECVCYLPILGLYSLSGKDPEIFRSLEEVGYGFRFIQSLWNLTDTSAAVLLRHLSFSDQIDSVNAQSHDFHCLCDKPSCCLVTRSPGSTLAAICWTNNLLSRLKPAWKWSIDHIYLEVILLNLETHLDWLHSLRPHDPYVCQWIGSLLVQIMAWCKFELDHHWFR